MHKLLTTREAARDLGMSVAFSGKGSSPELDLMHRIREAGASATYVT